jgi:hypothetical protein
MRRKNLCEGCVRGRHVNMNSKPAWAQYESPDLDLRFNECRHLTMSCARALVSSSLFPKDSEELWK